MLYLETVESSTLELLKKLQRLPVLEQTRLVGGTALALQLGHRKSIDLDFFGTVDCEAEYLRESIAGIASLTILKESPHIHIYIVDGIKVDIVNYKYPWLDDVVLEQGLRLECKRYCSYEDYCNHRQGYKEGFYRYRFLAASLFIRGNPAFLCSQIQRLLCFHGNEKLGLF